ncbi:hypothetical protein [Paenibacillus amylolyticus]|uniref:hypothetical protein n=1 Tax=Paenibacillus amylolyticus TaxID=1451 RepID=UPI003EB9EC60
MLAIAVLFVIFNLMVWIDFSLVYWLTPVIIIIVLSYVDLFFAEKKSSAFILESEIVIHRVYAFGLFIYVYHKRLTNNEAEAIVYYLDKLESQGNQPLSIETINKLVHADIIFYRNLPVFS